MRLIDADRFLSQIEDQYMEHGITREKYMDLEDRIMQQTTIEQPHWIPITERMPKVGKTVICQCRADILKLLKLDSGGDWYQDAEHAYMSGFVLAWMPMPEPWKGEEK